MESSKRTGCRASECPILCINNCGFFGSATTMNMCSKCHKDTILKQSSIENIVKGGSKEPSLADAQATSIDLQVSAPQPSSGEVKVYQGPNRCTTCGKRIGLTGFNCRCGNTFCSIHRCSDKHDCPIDYRTDAQDAIAQSNPIIKAQKLDKI